LALYNSQQQHQAPRGMWNTPGAGPDVLFDQDLFLEVLIEKRFFGNDPAGNGYFVIDWGILYLAKP
jgi:hypothetical protein